MRMCIRWMVWVLPALLAGASGCGDGLGDCPPNSAARQTEGKQAIAYTCLNCHASVLTGAERGGAPDGYDFDKIAVVREEAGEIYTEVEEGAMPPSGALNATEVESIRIYLACGAK
jgi:cytochrome c5